MDIKVIVHLIKTTVKGFMINQVLFHLYIAIGYSWMFFCVLKYAHSVFYTGFFEYMIKSVLVGIFNWFLWPISVIISISIHGKSAFTLWKK